MVNTIYFFKDLETIISLFMINGPGLWACFSKLGCPPCWISPLKSSKGKLCMGCTYSWKMVHVLLNGHSAHCTQQACVLCKQKIQGQFLPESCHCTLIFGAAVAKIAQFWNPFFVTFVSSWNRTPYLTIAHTPPLGTLRLVRHVFLLSLLHTPTLLPSPTPPPSSQKKTFVVEEEKKQKGLHKLNIKTAWQNCFNLKLDLTLIS